MFKIKASGGGFKPVKSGTYDAILYGIIELGVQKGEYKGKAKTPNVKLKFLFEIPSLMDEEGRSKVVGKDINYSKSQRGNLYKFLRGMGFIEDINDEVLDELFGSEEGVQSMLGTQVSLFIDNFELDDGNTMHSISSVSKLDQRVIDSGEGPVSVLAPMEFNFDNPDLELFKNKLTKYTRSQIIKSLNSGDLPREFHEVVHNEELEDKKNDVAKDVL